MNLRIHNKPTQEKPSVFITGGTSGIGTALVDYYIKQGYRVHTCGRNKKRIEQLRTNYPKEAFSIVEVDLSTESACKSWINQGTERFKCIDILIINAGTSMKALIQETDTKTTEKVMQINFMASVYLVQSALPWIIKKQGSIVAISSIASIVALPGRSVYAASKAALNLWFETLRKEVKHLGVHTLIVAPGFVETSIRKRALDGKGNAVGQAAKRKQHIMSAKRCAFLIAKAIYTKRKFIIVGGGVQARLAIMLVRYLPTIADKMIRKSYLKDGKLTQ